MHIRDFLRGEYKNIKEPTVITKHSRPVATWTPFDGKSSFKKWSDIKRSKMPKVEDSSSR